jgi:hypothetical protein
MLVQKPLQVSSSALYMDGTSHQNIARTPESQLEPLRLLPADSEADHSEALAAARVLRPNNLGIRKKDFSVTFVIL